MRTYHSKVSGKDYFVYEEKEVYNDRKLWDSLLRMWRNRGFDLPYIWVYEAGVVLIKVDL